mgnify:CR=1 FL=1
MLRDQTGYMISSLDELTPKNSAHSLAKTSNEDKFDLPSNDKLKQNKWTNLVTTENNTDQSPT